MIQKQIAVIVSFASTRCATWKSHPEADAVTDCDCGDVGCESGAPIIEAMLPRRDDDETGDTFSELCGGGEVTERKRDGRNKEINNTRVVVKSREERSAKNTQTKLWQKTDSSPKNIPVIKQLAKQETRKMRVGTYRCEAENIDSPTTEPRRARIKAPPPPLPPLPKPPVTEKAVSDRPSFDSRSLRRSSASASSLRRCRDTHR